MKKNDYVFDLSALIMAVLGIDQCQRSRFLAAASCVLLVMLLLPAITHAQEKPAPEKLYLTLEESIRIALEKSPLIRISRLSRDALGPEIRRAKAVFHPVLGASYTGTESHPVDELGPGAPIETQTARGFIAQEMPTGGLLILSNDITRDIVGTAPALAGSDVTISLVQPLLRNGRVYVATRPIKDAEYDVRIEEARLRAEVLRVTADTARAYYNWNLASRVIEVVRAAIQRDEALIEASEALLAAGLVTVRDVISARVSLTKDSDRLVSAEADAESAKNAFFDVLGLPLESRAELLDKEIKFEPVPLEPEKWIATAVQDRPEVMELEERLAKSSLNVEVADNALLPQLDFVGSYTKAQTNTTLRRAYGLRGDEWSAGLVVSVPLGNVAAESGLVRARIEHARLKEQLFLQKRQVELEVRAAELKLRTSRNRIDALGKVLEHAKELYEVAKASFARGLATNLDITSAQEDILDAETDLLRAIVDFNTGLAELEAALAGRL